jgi:hypothetical protein
MNQGFVAAVVKRRRLVLRDESANSHWWLKEFKAPMRIQSWRSKLPMNLVAADVSPLHLIRGDVRADSRRLL